MQPTDINVMKLFFPSSPTMWLNKLERLPCASFFRLSLTFVLTLVVLHCKVLLTFSPTLD
jgi:hypothetical protein